MRLVIQRVKKASVLVNNQIVGSINSGALVFLAIHKDDLEKQIVWLVNKLLNLRFFSDSLDKMNLSLKDTNKEVLVVSQFTLYADTLTGRRPSFTQSAHPEKAKNYYDQFIKLLQKEIKVETGVFGAKMEVELINDGPVTFIIDAKEDV